MWNVLYRILIGIEIANCLFQQKKSDNDVKLNWRSQLFISGIIRLKIIQKNTLSKNKICVIYFCPNCVNFFARKRSFFLGGRSGGKGSPCAYMIQAKDIFEAMQNACKQKQAKLLELKFGKENSHWTQIIYQNYDLKHCKPVSQNPLKGWIHLKHFYEFYQENYYGSILEKQPVGAQIGFIFGIFVRIFITNFFRIHSNNTVQDFFVIGS